MPGSEVPGSLGGCGLCGDGCHGFLAPQCEPWFRRMITVISVAVTGDPADRRRRVRRAARVVSPVRARHVVPCGCSFVDSRAPLSSASWQQQGGLPRDCVPRCPCECCTRGLVRLPGITGAIPCRWLEYGVHMRVLWSVECGCRCSGCVGGRGCNGSGYGCCCVVAVGLSVCLLYACPSVPIAKCAFARRGLRAVVRRHCESATDLAGTPRRTKVSVFPYTASALDGPRGLAAPKSRRLLPMRSL